MRFPVKYLISLLVLMNVFSTLNAQTPAQNMLPPVGPAFLRSLILPGWGERSLNQDPRGNAFLTTETVLWMGYGLLGVLARRNHDNMIEFAVQNAGVKPVGKSSHYFDDIGKYNSLADYNDQMLRDRQSDMLYPVTDGTYAWSWNNNANRQRYKDLKFSRNLYQNFAVYMLGAVTINHFASAIDVLWLQQHRLGLKAAPIIQGNQGGLQFTLNF